MTELQAKFILYTDIECFYGNIVFDQLSDILAGAVRLEFERICTYVRE
jgi:hypothetical protein